MTDIDPTMPLEVPERRKQIDYPNLNLGTPLPGNQNALKFNTSAKRKALCAAYCLHRQTGFSKESFVECDMQTFRKYIAEYPSDFDTELIDKAEKENLHFWEDAGIKGMQGKIKGYNSDSWKFNMSNRFKWKMREDMTTDDKSLNIVIKRAPTETDS